MPESVEMVLRVPDELGDHDDIVAQLRLGIERVEATCARERMQTGRTVVGRRRILRQSWRDSPASQEPRRNLRPRVAARNKWARIAALQRNRDFLRAYHAALPLWREGKPAVFPAGTSRSRVFANVVTEPFVSRRGPPVPTAN